MTLGVWPEVELADARAKRDAARQILAKGCDPAEHVKLDKITASISAANTFKAVAEEWYAKAEKEGLAPDTLNKIRWLLTFAYASFGNRPIANISPHELLAVPAHSSPSPSARLRLRLKTAKRRRWRF